MKIQRRTLLAGAIATAALPLLAACGGSDDDDTPAASLGTIVDIASANSDFSVLVEAVVAAGLVDTLNGTGPFTVFAPTNDAFVALLGDLGLTKDALLANKDLLTAVLLHHVLGSEVLSSGITFGTPVDTLTQPLSSPQQITINNATAPAIATITDASGTTPASNIVAVDVRASNGVIHVIDKVLIPVLSPT